MFKSLIIIASFSAALTSPCMAQARDVELAEQLRQGGIVIFLRHGVTRPNEESVARLDGCKDERNLTDAGRAAMQEVRRAIEEIDFEVSEVLVSPFCRAYETARIAFGSEQVTDVLASRIDDERNAERLAATRELLSTAPPPGTVRVLVAHYSNLRDALGVTVEEGEAAIFLPTTKSQAPKLLARVRQEEWAAVAAGVAQLE